MGYFNYHATAKKLINEGKLLSFYFCEKHNKISPALVLVFNDLSHPIMPIRQERWAEYLQLINKNNQN
jgi:hypothetical protein